MEMHKIIETAKQRLKGYCRVCKICDGRVCASEVPGMGGAGTGESFKQNLRALADVKLAMRTIHDAREPDTGVTTFGKACFMPVHVAPMTGVTYNMGGDMSEEEFIRHIVQGCTDAGTLAWSGDGANPAMLDAGLDAMRAVTGGVVIIKPRAQAEIIERIKKAEDAGAVAVGVDVDGAGLVTMAQFGQPVGPKTEDELAELVNATSLPFVVKGVMTTDEADAACRAGAAAIVVSNHGGRILDHTPGSAEVLPAIAQTVAGRAFIYADGGVRSGADVLKMLALGADSVLIGRPAITGAFGGGAEGVATVLNTCKAQLTGAMILTGCRSVADVDSRVLHA